MARSIRQGDSYLDKLLKIIPSEVVAGYIAIIAIIQGHPKEETYLLVSSIALLIFIPLILRILQNVTNWFHIIVSMMAYVIWVYALGGPFVSWGLHDPILASVIIILYTFLIPFAIKTQP
jgi:hypothetical protein